MASIWKATLHLRPAQRDGLDELATNIRRHTDVRPGASELIRAAVDAMLERLKGEGFEQLSELVGTRGPREAAPIIEKWLVDKMNNR